MIYANGDRYEGEWLSDQKHGRGKYSHALANDIYEGEWVNDRKHGKGTYKFGYMQFIIFLAMEIYTQVTGSVIKCMERGSLLPPMVRCVRESLKIIDMHPEFHIIISQTILIMSFLRELFGIKK